MRNAKLRAYWAWGLTGLAAVPIGCGESRSIPAGEDTRDGGAEGGIAAGPGGGDAGIAGEGDSTTCTGDSALPPCGPKCTSTPRTLDKQNDHLPDAGLIGVAVSRVAVNRTHLFYTLVFAEPNPTHVPSMIWRVPLHGGPASLVTTTPAPRDLLLTGTSVIFNDGSGIFGVPLDGGTPALLGTAHGTIGSIATDGENVYFDDNDGTEALPVGGGSARTITPTTGWIAPIGTDLILAEPNGDILRVPIAGGTPTAIAHNPNLDALYPTACGADICWGTVTTNGVMGGVGTIERLTPAGVRTTIASDGAFFQMNTLLFSDTVFIVSARYGLYEVVAEGGKPFVPPGPAGFGMGGVAADESCLYWSDFEGVHAVSK